MRTAALLLVPLLCLTGCGQKTSIRGNVTYNGSPIADGAITLLPADGSGATSGGKITNGRYVVEEVTPGAKIVQIIGVKEVKFVASSAELEQMSEEMKLRTSRTDVVFAADDVPGDAIGNNVEIEIASGDQELNFDLMPPEQ